MRRRADRDTDAIADYIGARNAGAGRRFFLPVKENSAFLADNPKAGAIRSTGRRSLNRLRSWPIKGFENYLIFYLPKRTHVEIVRVLHGAQDMGRIFGER